MRTLLFVCSRNADLSQMAEAIGRTIAPPDLKVRSAGIDPAPAVADEVAAVMSEVGIDVADHKPNSLSDIELHDIDAVVALCEGVDEKCKPRLPGHPLLVSWDLPDPGDRESTKEKRLEHYRACRDAIERLTKDLIDGGYLDTLVRAKEQALFVLDSLFEGILVHDLERRIIYFNRAAESITGYTRRELVGKDCHDVFPQSFCGKECSFCDSSLPHFDQKSYPLVFHTKSGEERQLELSVRSIVGRDEEIVGVIASFRDLTREQTLARRLGEIEQFSGIVGRDSSMQEVFDLIRSVAESSVPAMIQGESGTGKELVAAAIHNEGPRSNKLFVPVNCGALPEGLLESELFGHVRGAFTGAVRDKKGRFELAHGGTIFLDEIGDISLAMQVKLLRVLQEGTFERVGGTKTIRVNARVISATNKILKEEIAAGRFREDLYYRLCVVPIVLPPLRDRRADIPLLVNHFLRRMAKDAGKESLNLTPDAMDALLSHEWPGNVRELQNALQFALVKSRKALIEHGHLPPNIIRTLEQGFVIPAPAQPKGPSRGRKVKLTQSAVEEALVQTGGNKAKAARLLKVGRATLYRFLESEKSGGD